MHKFIVSQNSYTLVGNSFRQKTKSNLPLWTQELVLGKKLIEDLEAIFVLHKQSSGLFKKRKQQRKVFQVV